MKKFLRHYFFPHSKNNHRAKLLHHSVLFLWVLGFLVATYAAVNVHHEVPGVLGISYSITSSDLLSLTNKMRQENGEPALTLNSDLNQAAAQKADDMFAKNYWAHFAPDGSTTPWMFIKNSGYNYVYAGENLAKGFTTSSDIVTAWMNSPSHRENLLSGKYKDIGFAVKEGTLQGEDTVLVVQMFGSPQTATADISSGQDVAAAQSSPANIPVAAVPNPTTIPLPTSQPAPAVVHPPAQAVVSASAINLRSTTATASIFILSLFVFAFLLDMIVIEKKKIPRIVGHNLDHILLIVLFILFAVLGKSGGIL